MPRLTGNRAARLPDDAHGASRRDIVKHFRPRRASTIRFPPTNRYLAPVSAIGFSALRAANSWMPDSRLRTDRPTVTFGSYRTILTARSRNRLEMMILQESWLWTTTVDFHGIASEAAACHPNDQVATQEKRRVANRRVNRGSEAQGRQTARQVVTSKMRSMYSRSGYQRSYTGHATTCATSHGDVRSILGNIHRQQESRGRNRGLQHIRLCLATTMPLLRWFFLGWCFLRRFLLSGRLLRRLLVSFLGRLLGRFLRSLLLGWRFLGSFLFRRSSLDGSTPARRRSGRAAFGCDFRFGFVHFHLFIYHCGFRLLFFLFLLFIFFVFERIAIGTVSVVIHLIVVTTVELFIECHVHPPDVAG